MENNTFQQQITTSNLLAPLRDGDDGFCFNIHTEEKKLRLFGFEVDSYAEGEKHQRPEGDESANSSDASLSKIEKIVEEKSSICKLEHKKFECQFCLKEFANSQALGGHQNAHKKERSKNKRKQLEARMTNFNFYLQPHQNHRGFVCYNSPPWFNDVSPFVPELTLYKESQINSNPLDQNQNLHVDGSFFSKSTSLASHNHFRPVVIKPLPSYISEKSCQSLAIQLGLTRESNICSSSRSEV